MAKVLSGDAAALEDHLVLGERARLHSKQLLTIHFILYFYFYFLALFQLDKLSCD